MAGTTTRPRTRKTPTARARPVAVIDDPVEVLAFEAHDDDGPEDRVVLVTIKGEPLTIPAVIEPALGMKIMKTARIQGEAVAMMQMLEEVMGEDAYDKLIDYKPTSSQLEQLVLAVQRHVMGALETPKGSSRGA